MKIEKEIELPNREDIEVSLRLGDEVLEFSLKPIKGVDQEALKEIDERIEREWKAPMEYAKTNELISVSEGLVSSYKKRVEEEKAKKRIDKKKILSLEEKIERELENLKKLYPKRDELSSKPFEIESLQEEKVRLFCSKGIDALERYVEFFSWSEALNLVSELLTEARGKK